MAVDELSYDARHGVVVCRQCRTCLSPDGPRQWRRHLRREPHGLKDERLARAVGLLSTYELRTRDELRRRRPDRRVPCERIEGLATYGGYICLCDPTKCDFATRRLEMMEDHMPRHGRTAREHHGMGAVLWRSCTLQTYFTAKGLIDYFVVAEVERRERNPESEGHDHGQPGCGEPPPSSPERQVFEGLREDMRQAGRDLEVKASAVEDLGQGRADRERWLVHTGFPTYLRGLPDAEIKSSYRLPRSKELLAAPARARGAVKDKGVVRPDESLEKTAARGGRKGGRGGNDGEGDDGEEDLRRMLAATEAWLRKAYGLVAERSTERKMTHQRARLLSNFAAGSTEAVARMGKDLAFRCFKNESTLVTYFRRMKELMAFYYRVVYAEDGHFSREGEAPMLPQDTIKPTGRQRAAMDEIHEALREQDRRGDGGDEADLDGRLESAVREFYVALICQTVGSALFESPVISFCAMLSRVKAFSSSRLKGSAGARAAKRGAGDDELDEAARRRRDMRCWREPGNYSSDLSALIWTAQLALFELVCFEQRGNEDRIPAALGRICERYMSHKRETAFGHILQWRPYLSAVARSAVSRHQARWSLCGQEITYLGTTLRLTDVSKLLLSEYRRACRLLFDDLLFGAAELAAVEAWRLHDDLDVEDYGGSWLTDERNADMLRGSEDALLRQIEQRADLRKLFVGERRKETGAATLRREAMAAYEADVQEFLRAVVPLLFISPMPPLRAPEFLSITFSNTGGRRRSMFVWEKMLMIHVRYRKSAEQTGKDGDNLRFVPDAVAELVLTFLAVVQPLRQVFLREVMPGALLSPYLFSKLDGEVWRDETVSKCLQRACTRAEVQEFKVGWWRQAAASITKEKFTPGERANFDLTEYTDVPDTAAEGEELLVDMAEASNHTFRTFNQAYAGSTTLTMNTIMHRAYRASLSWRTLFRVDDMLARERAGGSQKRPLLAGGDDAQAVELGMLSAHKRARLRTRPLATERELLATARSLYNDPSLQFRRPGQRDSMLAAAGKHAAEQVIIVLATGTGKTLIPMVAAALKGARTTILILPMVALRSNMLDRLRRADIQTTEWTAGETSRAARVVVVSAEAACTRSFLEYAHRLECRQRLDRIVVDECHLTVTARYRKSMRNLGSYVRQIRTQTVWLTATLPPSFEEAFIQRNFLVRPRMVRESTNRPNVRYRIREYGGPGRLRDEAADLIRSLLRGGPGTTDSVSAVLGDARSRVIVYCGTIDLMKELADELDGCPTYTGDRETMSAEEKEAAIGQWLGPTGSPVIVATSALGLGFDYPHVRLVVHVGAPQTITDFSQESGRAGRDGRPAESITLLSAAWKPQVCVSADEEAMQLYLSRLHCLRGVMGQFLDREQDWTWCMEDRDELCDVCPEHHREPRPAGSRFTTTEPTKGEPAGRGESGHGEDETISDEEEDVGGTEMGYSGPAEILRQTRRDEEVLRRFEANMEVMRECCLLCRAKDLPFDHCASSCWRRQSWIGAKKRVLKSCQSEGKPWMADYTACFMCYLPQSICRRADPEAAEKEKRDDQSADKCRYKDMIIPLCYGAFMASAPRALLHVHFSRRFRNLDDYMRWLGEEADIGGVPCTQAVRVCAMLLEAFIS